MSRLETTVRTGLFTMVSVSLSVALPAGAPGEAGLNAAQQVDANYDFEAGERVLVREDYSSDNVGDFPRNLEFRLGNIAVVDVDGRRMLRLEGPSEFDVALPETLPEQFTIEFDVQLERFHTLRVGSPVGDIAIEHRNHPFHHFRVSGESDGAGIVTGGSVDAAQAATGGLRTFVDQQQTIRIMVDDNHGKMYTGTTRISNLPSGNFARGTSLRFRTDGAGRTALIGPIRIAAGGRDLYDAIASEGRVAVHDILFDTDAATIRPESTDVLGEIAALLEEHAELRLMIEGHTDATGDFDHNMELSTQRAESVMQWLVERHVVASERLRTIGLGPTHPKDSNESEEGRQQNRRVELVRIGG